MTAVGMEIRKMKRKHYWLMASGATALQLLWLAAMALKRSTGVVEARLMVLSFTEPLYLGLLLMPIVAALLASRLVTLDTEERMDQLFTALKQRAATRFTAKLVVGSASIAAGESLFIGLLATAGPVLGLRNGAGYQEAFWPGLVVLLAASVATMAVQLALATCLEKQAIGLGVAVVAGIVSSALPFMYLAPLGWALPWGLPAAANPVSTRLLGQTGMETALVTHPWVNALGAVLAATAWVCISRFIVKYKENHR
ncbi:ABC transporter permease [[Pseudopropionibacterium] massiliense]|uniref:ABC transporter permease n=1 Tax=[Pseudopropionibacterium] massiliense TaxID=2220000 RepID=UPI0010300B3D|nr:ABC transporter permease [[Pseudopropionibacterium] massiliense]